MLTVLLLTILTFSQGLSMDSRGTSFITAFPETIAVYFKKAINQLKITTLHPDTTINITNMASGNIFTNEYINNGTTLTVNLTKGDEEYQFVSSNKSFRITSNKNITVLSLSGWEGRFLPRVIQPEQNLGTVYQVSALNFSKITESFGLQDVRLLPFRLMIINAVGRDNNFTIKQVDKSGQSQESRITLGPYKLLQIQINGTVREINAEDKVAVLLTHPCFESKNCSCNMVVKQLRPAATDTSTVRFLVPPVFSPIQLLMTTDKPFRACLGYLNNENEQCILVQNSTDVLPLFANFTSNFSLISITVPVSLQLVSPGLILDLIQTRMFSGCYLLDFKSSNSGALVIASTSSTSDVKMNDQSLPSSIKWNVMNSEYSWALVEGQNIGTIWHPTSRIGVYMIERLEFNITYASPAIVLNTDPDPNGCLVTPESFILGKDKMNWFMSRNYCLANADQLSRLVSQAALDKMILNMTGQERTEGWISLRRDLFTTEWYWKNEDNFPSTVDFTHWESKQPENPENGLCASVSLDPSKKFMWRSTRCCSKMKPICYKTPKYFTYSDIEEHFSEESEEDD